MQNTGHSDQILDKLRAVKPSFKEWGLKRVRVFGSVIRREAGPDSDVDILVDFLGSPTLFHVMDVQDRFAALLNSPVDIVTTGGLHPALKEIILGEARDV